jgi:hypothetical protein
LSLTLDLEFEHDNEEQESLTNRSAVFCRSDSSDIRAQQSSQSVKAVQIIGLPAVKENAKGTLAVENGNLRFVHGKGISDISTSSIQDIVTGTDSQKAVGKTVGTISMAAPYGGGRF